MALPDSLPDPQSHRDLLAWLSKEISDLEAVHGEDWNNWPLEVREEFVGDACSMAGVLEDTLLDERMQRTPEEEEQLFQRWRASLDDNDLD